MVLVATELKVDLFFIYAVNGFHKVVYGCLLEIPFSAGLVCSHFRLFRSFLKLG